MITFPAQACPPTWLMHPTCTVGGSGEGSGDGNVLLGVKPNVGSCRMNSWRRRGPRIPQRGSRVWWLQMRIVGIDGEWSVVPLLVRSLRNFVVGAERCEPAGKSRIGVVLGESLRGDSGLKLDVVTNTGCSGS